MSSSKKETPINQLIEVMRGLDSTQYHTIINEIMGRNASLAEAILEAMFSFEDLIYITDKSMQTLIRDVDRKLLIRALKKTTNEVNEKVFNNLSRRASERLREEINLGSPIRLSEVKEAQRSIANLARSMEEAGKIVMVRPNDDDPLV
jgi:flagellar motor switch protein FliG